MNKIVLLVFACLALSYGQTNFLEVIMIDPIGNPQIVASVPIGDGFGSLDASVGMKTVDGFWQDYTMFGHDISVGNYLILIQINSFYSQRKRRWYFCCCRNLQR
jgi:hypothetical protein